MSNRTDNKTMDVFVIVPCYNENAVIATVLARLVNFNYSIVVVDDGSQTPLDFLLSNFPVTLLRHSVNLGQGAALQTGIDYALSQNAKYIVTFDADGQHNADDIKNLIAALDNNEADIVLGSRFIAGGSHNMNSGRKAVIQFARLLNYIFTGLLLTDAHNGLRAMNRKAASSIYLQENGMAHATEFLAIIKKNKLRFKEVPVTIQYSDYSKAKGQTIWSGFRIFFDILLSKIFR